MEILLILRELIDAYQSSFMKELSFAVNNLSDDDDLT
jgi:hypothetical protein